MRFNCKSWLDVHWSVRARQLLRWHIMQPQYGWGYWTITNWTCLFFYCMANIHFQASYSTSVNARNTGSSGTNYLLQCDPWFSVMKYSIYELWINVFTNYLPPCDYWVNVLKYSSYKLCIKILVVWMKCIIISEVIKWNIIS